MSVLSATQARGTLVVTGAKEKERADRLAIPGIKNIWMFNELFSRAIWFVFSFLDVSLHVFDA